MVYNKSWGDNLRSHLGNSQCRSFKLEIPNKLVQEQKNFTPTLDIEPKIEHIQFKSCKHRIIYKTTAEGT